MPKKLTQQQFEERANLKHNFFYNYSNVIYVDYNKNVNIICNIHGVFQQTPHHHLDGQGCPDCYNERRGKTLKLTQQQFEDKANLVHNYIYDYTNAIYVDYNDYVNIICNIHGQFPQTPHHHLSGQGCPDCYNERRGDYRVSNTNEFIEKANIVHNYLYKYPNVNYINCNDNVFIECEIHGQFSQTPYQHLSGSGCPKCYGRNKTTEEFIKEANIVHNYLYTYPETNYINCKKSIIISCVKHGSFSQSPNSHLRGEGCPTCKNSKGALEVERILKLYNLNYEKEKKFSDCVYIKPLPFDFYLTDMNILIEFDGEQHYIKRSRFNKKFGDFESIQRNDTIKNEYCDNNNIQLIRITYKEFREKQIENILIEKLNLKHYK